MAKANYTKVEEALGAGLLKMNVTYLWEIAEAATASLEEKSRSLGQILAIIQFELKHLQRLGVDPYEKLKINRKELKKFIADPKALKAEDLEKIKKLRENIETLKKELETKSPQASDEDIVTKQRTKHINKRFNVNEKWLPLH